jgi:hypothetical protein
MTAEKYLDHAHPAVAGRVTQNDCALTTAPTMEVNVSDIIPEVPHRLSAAHSKILHPDPQSPPALRRIRNPQSTIRNSPGRSYDTAHLNHRA